MLQYRNTQTPSLSLSPSLSVYLYLFFSSPLYLFPCLSLSSFNLSWISPVNISYVTVAPPLQRRRRAKGGFPMLVFTPPPSLKLNPLKKHISSSKAIDRLSFMEELCPSAIRQRLSQTLITLNPVDWVRSFCTDDRLFCILASLRQQKPLKLGLGWG